MLQTFGGMLSAVVGTLFLIYGIILCNRWRRGVMYRLLAVLFLACAVKDYSSVGYLAGMSAGVSVGQMFYITYPVFLLAQATLLSVVLRLLQNMK